MEAARTKYFVKIIACIFIACVFSMCVREGNAMELVEDQKERQELCISNAKQYEMNIVLWDLGIKDDWIWPPYAPDEQFLVPDPPLGEYSKEALRQYTDEEDLYAEVEYYFGGHQPLKAEDKYLIQIIQTYKGNKQIGFEGKVWSWNGDAVMTGCGFRMNQ